MKTEKKNKKENTPGWIGTSTRGTPQLDSPKKRHSSTITRLDWGINTGKHSKLQSHGGRVSQVVMTANLLLPRKSLSKHDPASIRSQEKQTAPCREGHRYAGPVAVVPLPQQTPSNGVKPSNPDLSQAVSPSPLRRHNARGPRHTRRWTSSSLSSPCKRHRGLATSATVLHATYPFLKSPSG